MPGPCGLVGEGVREGEKAPRLAFGLSGGFLHEVFAAGPEHLTAASGFAAASARLAAEARPVIWIAPSVVEAEAGRLHPSGLVELGIDPASIVLVRTRDVPGALRAADEAARCEGLGAVVMESWGDAAQLDLTATRRLSLGARRSRAAVILLHAKAPAPGASFTRWSVRAAPSRVLPANAPGPPAFTIALVKHRGGAPLMEWTAEWDRETVCFRERSADAAATDATLSRPVVSLPAHRPVAAGIRLRRVV
jgi:protein ImuA